MARKRKYTHHKENCDALVRNVSIDAFGNKIILIGIHAFEWSLVYIVNDVTVITTFHNRISAMKEYNRKRGK